MYKVLAFFAALVLVGFFSWFLLSPKGSIVQQSENYPLTDQQNLDNFGGVENELHSLSIEALRKAEYPGSDLVIEQTLSKGSNYKRYIVSYKSEGLKIYALLTVPNGEPPKSGWPVIIFNHGYIPPTQYQTTERYVAYTDIFSRNGYVLLKPDYRGHGNSEGIPSGAYGSNGYTMDVLNAVSSIKKYPGVNPDKIGMWGHSLGGFLTLRNMVISKDVKAGVIWAGVIASYPDLLNNWRRRNAIPPPGIPAGARRWRDELTEKYGPPEQNPSFWNSISANSYLADVSGPIQLHHGTEDQSVPIEFSKKLEEQLKATGKVVELYTYPGDDHNLSANLSLALQRSVEYFDKYLKGGI